VCKGERRIYGIQYSRWSLKRPGSSSYRTNGYSAIRQRSIGIEDWNIAGGAGAVARLPKGLRAMPIG
jgi:hypothetical protein